MHPRLKARARLGLQVLFDFNNITDAIEFAAGSGFRVLEINLGNLRFGRQLRSARERVKIRQAARRHRVRLAVHALEGPSFFIPSRRVVRCAVAEIRELLGLAHEAGIAQVVMHLGFEMHYAVRDGVAYLHDAFPDQFERQVADALAELRECARGQARLCIENVGGFRFDFVRALLTRLLNRDLGLCWDVGHTAILPREKRDAELAFFERHRRRIYHAHLHDNCGERDEHLAVGRGTIDFVPACRILAEVGADMVFEVRPREAALQSLEYFRRRVEPKL